MPSRRLRRPAPRRSSPAPSPRSAVLTALLLAAGAASLAGSFGCATAKGPATPAPEPVAFPGLPAEDRSYLPDPREGYPLAIGADAGERLTAAYAGLRASLDRQGARTVADELLAVDPRFHPAIVLAAEAEFAAGDPGRAAAALAPVVAELPGYAAAEVLLGRAAERSGDPLAAFAAFRRVADLNALAAERAAELKPRAVEIVANRIGDAIARGRLDAAQADLGLLTEWAPGESPTLEAAAGLARARGDRRSELTAVAALARLHPEDRELAERWGDLELEAGDPGAGLALFERLARDHPRDAALAARVEQAKFRWRFAQLPARVQQAAHGAEITRGDFAVLLYWLVPSVRFGQPGAARIATDILDDPRRDEIAKVVNLGLLDVDAGLHRFAPDAALARGDALLGLLRLIAGSGGREAGGAARPAASCAAELPAAGRPAPDQVCAAAARCRLLPDPADCLPRSPLSGREALELVRLGLDLVR